MLRPLAQAAVWTIGWAVTWDLNSICSCRMNAVTPLQDTKYFSEKKGGGWVMTLRYNKKTLFLSDCFDHFSHLQYNFDATFNKRSRKDTRTALTIVPSHSTRNMIFIASLQINMRIDRQIKKCWNDPQQQHASPVQTAGRKTASKEKKPQDQRQQRSPVHNVSTQWSSSDRRTNEQTDRWRDRQVNDKKSRGEEFVHIWQKDMAYNEVSSRCHPRQPASMNNWRSTPPANFSHMFQLTYRAEV